MREFLLISVAALAAFDAEAYTPRRADVVAAQAPAAASPMTAGSLLATAINLGIGAMALQNQLKATAAACVPSVSDVNFVQRMVLEVAKTGVKASEFTKSAGGSCLENVGNDFKTRAQNIHDGQAQRGEGKCADTVPTGDSIWDGTNVRLAANCTINGISFCTGTGDSRVITMDGALLKGFPIVSNENVQRTANQANRANFTNIHDIFAAAMGYFQPDDLLESEINQAHRLSQLSEQCSETRLRAQQRQLWMNFAGGAIMGLGEGNMQADIGMAMQAAQGAAGGAGVTGTLLQMAPMFLGAQ